MTAPLHRRRRLIALAAAVGVPLIAIAAQPAGAVAGGDVRLSNDSPTSGGYVSDYTLTTGNAYTDATLNECSQSRGRQNEPSVTMDPRNPNVVVGSSNDYCGVYNDGVDTNGAPIPSGPIWLGYYRSTNGGSSFASSLVPGYPGDTSPYASLANIRTASSGDPVMAWDKQGRLFMGSESSDDADGTPKSFGDEWVATYQNPDGVNGATSKDGLKFTGSTIVAKGTAAPNYNGRFNDKTAIEVDRTNSACQNTVYFAWSLFDGYGKSEIDFARSTDHGKTWSMPMQISQSEPYVQGPEISVLGDGRVVVTWGSQSVLSDKLAVSAAKSTDCGASFTKGSNVVSFTPYSAQDVSIYGYAARDCGNLDAACQSGYTFFRHDPNPRATSDQSDPTSSSVWITYEGIVPGSEAPTGTTYGAAGPGIGGQGAVYAVKYNAATGKTSAPVRVAPESVGHQLFPDLTVNSGKLQFIWWDSHNDPSYSPLRPIGNYANGQVVPSLDVYTTTLTENLASAGPVTRLTDVSSNGNYDQFSGRTVPFAGDYLWIDSQAGHSYAVWTDWRNTVAGDDPRTVGNSGGEVKQCRTLLSDGTWTGDTCPRAGGLDQNIYGQRVS